MTDHYLNIHHQMIETSSNNIDQLVTRINHPRVRPLVVTPVPLLCALLHLSCIVGSQRQVLQVTTSSHGTRRDKVVQGEHIKGAQSASWTLNGLVDRLGRRISHVGIIASGMGVLDVVPPLEDLETLGAGVVDILGIGNELRRRRGSVGSRHFEWRTG